MLKALVAAGCTIAVLLVAGIVYAATRTDDSAKRPVPQSSANRFDAPAAMRLIRLQLRYGQRPAASKQLRALADRLKPLLPDGHFEDVPGQPGVRNVVGTIPGTTPGIVVGAHYDTLVKPKGFVGANNGAAGSAIVIQLARALERGKRAKDAPQIRFVLFDGEEPAQGLPEEQTDFYDTGLRGSRAYVQAHPGETKAMLLLDYVANKGLRLPREGTSTPELWAKVRAAAKEVGAGRVFPDRTGTAIVDDHTPFLKSGVPAVDLIDWDYQGHSLQDGYDKLSERSADAVGETLVQLLRTL